MKGDGVAVASQGRGRGLSLALIPLGLSYVIVGWNLSAHHILWFAGLILVLLLTASAWVTGPQLARLVNAVPKFFMAVFLVLAASLVLTFALIHALFPTLVIIPLGTTLFAWQELRALNIRKHHVILTLMAVALTGLGIGEGIDLWLLPSNP